MNYEAELEIRFQSTHPLRGATTDSELTAAVIEFQSTHPLRGATVFLQLLHGDLAISIHAPLAGCD